MLTASLPNSIFDSLILFLSQTQQGNWMAFTKAVKGMNIVIRPYWIAQRMFLLGHLDIDLEGDRSWNIAPPVLTRIGEREWYWSGFRSITIMQQVNGMLEGQGEFIYCEQEESPSSIILCTSSEVIGHVAIASKMTQTGQETPNRILANLPRVKDIQPERLPHSKPYGKKIELYRASAAQWTECTSDAAMEVHGTQLMRYGEDYDRTVSMRMDNCFYRIGFGLTIYYFLHQVHQSVLTYHRQLKTLSAPLTAPLPFLYGRALVMQSGKLPEKHGRRIFYTNVTASNAELAAQVLGQSMEVLND